MTAQEIIAKLKLIEEPSEVGCGSINEEVPELGSVELVNETEETNGTAFNVYYFKDHDVYIRHNGYYDSYESYSKFEDHDYEQVFPKEQTITVYDTVQ